MGCLKTHFKAGSLPIILSGEGVIQALHHVQFPDFGAGRREWALQKATRRSRGGMGGDWQ